MGFGSGFKCNSAVWRARRRIKNMHQAWDDFNLQEMRDHLASLPNHHKKPAAVTTNGVNGVNGVNGKHD
jgi:3-ketoacyl-CoA synthase